jgi:hypothetical protein
MKEDDFRSFAQLFADAVKNKTGVGEKVARFRGSFTHLGYCFEGEDLESLKGKLIETF